MLCRLSIRVWVLVHKAFLRKPLIRLTVLLSGYTIVFFEQFVNYARGIAAVVARSSTHPAEL
jgi:hypothetical protein